jgi:hypothetical protein
MTKEPLSLNKGDWVRIECRVSKYDGICGTVYEIQESSRYVVVDMPKGTELARERIQENAFLKGRVNSRATPPQGDPQWFPLEWLKLIKHP